MKFSKVFLFSWFIAYSLSCYGTPVDQSQTQSEKMNDWSSGVAQSFTVGYSGLLTAIRLPVQRKNGPRDLTLELTHIDANNIPTGPLLASGTLLGSDFVAGTTQWYTFKFAVPYEQTQGERLSFTLRIGPAGTPYGWLQFGQSTNNPYSSGLLYYSGTYGSQGWAYDKAYLDLAFQTLAVPKPQISRMQTSAGQVQLWMSNSYTECVYHVHCRTNLLFGDWELYTSTTGTQSALQWVLPVGAGTNQMFYRITAE